MVITVTLHPALDRILTTSQLRPEGVNRVQVVREYGGGKGNNVARALHRLGAPVLAFGFQGGLTGQIARRAFKREGIPTHFVSCRQPTRISTLIVESATGQGYTLYEPGQMVSPKELLNLKAQFLRIIGGFQIALFCGSAQHPALAHLMAELIGAAKQRGVVCVLDSSGPALREGIQAQPFMVKVNREELEEWLGERLETPTQLMAGLLQVHRLGVALVAVTQGEEGVMVTDGKVLWQGALKMKNVINVMGCGDSLLAGMTYALMSGLRLPEMVRWGVACGAANTQVLGAGFIQPTDVEALLPHVQLSHIEL
ncbi:1-phosphofructokinase family hexose kinase [uncultured Thermanaerothrix sp.]|uniref:1-phosphofructokinase family hexose kinase n=1 Tax=uncultured Thermanaerothrix sp. TaxID=1195149 RepID=UPI002633D8D9|nr:1-phosphofructokinase family hexose kinase [uncultured Thermanaerothrix sp.]